MYEGRLVEKLGINIFTVLFEEPYPEPQWVIWSLFVSACKLICKCCVTKQAVNECHILFGLFCRRFQELCGDLACKPNMHLSLHLKESFFDYGLGYAFGSFHVKLPDGPMGDTSDFIGN